MTHIHLKITSFTKVEEKKEKARTKGCKDGILIDMSTSSADRQNSIVLVLFKVGKGCDCDAINHRICDSLISILFVYQQTKLIPKWDNFFQMLLMELENHEFKLQYHLQQNKTGQELDYSNDSILKERIMSTDSRSMADIFVHHIVIGILLIIQHLGGWFVLSFVFNDILSTQEAWLIR